MEGPKPLYLSSHKTLSRLVLSLSTYHLSPLIVAHHRTNHPSPSPTMSSPPRILTVSRRMVRKNKIIHYVSDLHLSLLLSYKALPIILPPHPHIPSILDQYYPIHGLLLVEGEDISAQHNPQPVDPTTRLSIASSHPSDTQCDIHKDALELQLLRYCIRHNIPILAICRGAQLLNVACSGTLYPDIFHSLASNYHVNYQNYDTHRHSISILRNTPLYQWFNTDHIMVNSYHHQGIQHLADRFSPMAHAPDGLIEAFYDPSASFLVGLQFHPERMQNLSNALAGKQPIFDYPACRKPYQYFINAANKYQYTEKPIHPLLNNHIKYTHDDVRRVLRSGITVHGSTMLLDMLNNDEPLRPSSHNLPSKYLVSNRLQAAERACHCLSVDDLDDVETQLQRLLETVRDLRHLKKKATSTVVVPPLNVYTIA